MHIITLDAKLRIITINTNKIGYFFSFNLNEKPPIQLPGDLWFAINNFYLVAKIEKTLSQSKSRAVDWSNSVL